MPATATPLRAVAYLRVSSEEQAAEGVSLDVQEADCLRAAQQHGWQVTDILRDEGFSAFSRKPRPAFQELLSRLHEWDVVMVWRLDRLSRRSRETHAVADDMLQAGVRLFSCREELDTGTPAGRLMLAVIAGVAQYEPETIQERVRAGVAHVARSGRKLSFAPYGYRHITDAEGRPVPRQIIVPDPETAPVVRRVFAAYVEGATILQITRDLNREGLLTGRGKPWDHSRVSYLLRCPTYAGYVKHRDALLDGLHEPLVDRETWRRAQARRQRLQQVPPSARGRSLSPLLRCGLCGGAMYRRGADYTCLSHRHQPRDTRHPPVFWRAWILEGYLWLLVEWLLSPEGEEQYRRQTPRRATGRTTKLRAERDELEAAIRYNMEVGRAGGAAPRIVADLNAPLQARLEELEAALARMEEPTRTRRELRADVRHVQGLDYGRQREVLQVLFSEVVVGREKLVVSLRGGDRITIARQRGLHPGQALKLQVLTGDA